MNRKVLLKSKLSLAVVLACGLFGHAALAQTVIQAGQTVSGTLSSDAQRAENGAPYALYEYRGEAGERIRVRLNSDAFDAFLAVGTTAAPGCSGDCRTDDDGGDGLNSSLVFTLSDSGRAQIRASSIDYNANGAFQLSVTTMPAAAPARPQPLTLNVATDGDLSDESALDDRERPFQLWSVSGQPGQTVQVRMDSDNFDAYIEFGRMDGERFVMQSFDDDSGNGLNARLTANLDSQGTAIIKATSPNGSARGSYTLTVGDPPAQRPITVQDIKVGDSVRGRLDDTDPFDAQEIRFDVYRIEGRPGQRVVVNLQSSDFDAVLKWGVFEGDNFQQEGFDDDSGGGTNSQLAVTLDEDGVGRLVATALNASTGSYTVSVVAAPRPAGSR